MTVYEIVCMGCCMLLLPVVSVFLPRLWLYGSKRDAAEPEKNNTSGSPEDESYGSTMFFQRDELTLFVEMFLHPERHHIVVVGSGDYKVEGIPELEVYRLLNRLNLSHPRVALSFLSEKKMIICRQSFLSSHRSMTEAEKRVACREVSDVYVDCVKELQTFVSSMNGVENEER